MFSFSNHRILKHILYVGKALKTVVSLLHNSDFTVGHSLSSHYQFLGVMCKPSLYGTEGVSLPVHLTLSAS